MTPKKKLLVIIGSLAAVAGLIALAWWVRGLLSQPAKPVATPSASPTIKVRSLGNEKFGPRPRAAAAANVDVGVRTVFPVAASASPSPTVRGAAQAYPPATTQINQTPLAAISPAATAAPAPTATPFALPTPPTFTPLPGVPNAQTKEFVVTYAKGDPGKRRIFVRSIDRDKDDQVVNSPFDDFAPSFSSASQKIAYYSNEEGDSDASRPKSKLKIVDLATGKNYPIASDLPGVAPAAWSGDGKKIAIPTAGSIFISDITTGTSLQVPTGANPAGISWGPGNLKIYFQAKGSDGSNDIFEADTITAQAKAVVATNADETLPSASSDGAKLSYLRTADTQPATVVVRNLANSEERVLEKSSGANSYLWDLSMRQLIFGKSTGDGALQSLSGNNLQAIAAPNKGSLVSWDRDYQHVLLLVPEEQAMTLYSVDITSGAADKIKSGIAAASPAS